MGLEKWGLQAVWNAGDGCVWVAPSITGFRVEAGIGSREAAEIDSSFSTSGVRILKEPMQVHGVPVSSLHQGHDQASASPCEHRSTVRDKTFQIFVEVGLFLE